MTIQKEAVHETAWRLHRLVKKTGRFLKHRYLKGILWERKALRPLRALPERLSFAVQSAEVIDLTNDNRFAAIRIDADSQLHSQDQSAEWYFLRLWHLLPFKRIDRFYVEGSPEVAAWIDWAKQRAREVEQSTSDFENDLELIKDQIANRRIEVKAMGVYSVLDLPEALSEFVENDAINPSQLAMYIHSLNLGNHNRSAWADLTAELMTGKSLRTVLSPEVVRRDYKEGGLAVNEFGESSPNPYESRFLEIISLGVRSDPVNPGGYVLNTPSWLRKILVSAIQDLHDSIWICVGLGRAEDASDRLMGWADEGRMGALEYENVLRGLFPGRFKAGYDAKQSALLAVREAFEVISKRPEEKHLRMSALVGLQNPAKSGVDALRERIELLLHRHNVFFRRSEDALPSTISFLPLIKRRDVVATINPSGEEERTVPFPLGKAVGELFYPPELRAPTLNEYTIVVGADEWGNAFVVPLGTFVALDGGIRAGKTFAMRSYWDKVARLYPDFVNFIMDNKEAVARAKKGDFGWTAMFDEFGGEKRCRAYYSHDFGTPKELRDQIQMDYRRGVRHFVYYSSEERHILYGTDSGFFDALEDNINETEDRGGVWIDETLHWYVREGRPIEDAQQDIARRFWTKIARNLGEADRSCWWSIQTANAMRHANRQLHDIAVRLTDVWLVGAVPSTSELAEEVGINTQLYPDAEAQLAEIVSGFTPGDEISPLRYHGRFAAVARGGAIVKAMKFLTLNERMVLRFSRKETDRGFGL